MENVNSKNKKLTIIVGALLLVVGISFAYFIATTLINGKGSSVVGTTARIKGAEIRVEGTLEFNDTDVLPGHKNVSAIKVTATGNNQLIPYNLIWKGESGISQINYSVYKSSTPKTLSTSCERKTGVQNGMQVLSEECTITNIDTLGEAIASGSISKGDTKEILVQDEFITATTDGDTKYYYVVLEYPNLDEDQSSDANATFQGEVTVEESNKEADINILAVYVADGNGNYQETTDIPQSGYELNSEKSTCSNGTTPGWDANNSRFYADNLTKSGTSCYLYFDIYEPKVSETILANLTINTDEPDFGSAAITDDGVYKVSDPVYGGTSYYWRGLVTNNYVKFADKCWRIVRINGDGSIRLIYDGTTCHANGTNKDSIAVASIEYNTLKNQPYYVGWTYGSGQRPTLSTDSNGLSTGGTASNAKTQLESWYSSNITGTNASKVADGIYCNDRDAQAGSSYGSSSFNYAATKRIHTDHVPSLACNASDRYTLKVGLITVDEAMYAGGTNANNSSYYLYNGQTYWTMSPHWWNGDGSYAVVFRVDADGYLGGNYSVDSSCGLRPVINLKADVTFSSGNGTLETPYIVAD